MVKGIAIDITGDRLSELLIRVAHNESISSIMRHYNIGYSRYNNICNREKDRIDKIRQELAIEREKQFASKAIIKRDEILNSITEKDIKTSKLASKTAAIHDLTIDKRLETGQSTDNISVLSRELSDEDLKKYIIGVDNSVNNNDTKEEKTIVDSQNEENSK
jgi:hypothetical protein